LQTQFDLAEKEIEKLKHSILNRDTEIFNLEKNIKKITKKEEQTDGKF
jgi:hypothetical protein